MHSVQGNSRDSNSMLLECIEKYLSNQNIEFTPDLLQAFITECKLYINKKDDFSFEMEEKRMTTLIDQAIESWSGMNKIRLRMAVVKIQKHKLHLG